MFSFSCVHSGLYRHAEPMRFQSKQSAKRPMPSLLFDPPKMLRMGWCDWSMRQKMLTPVRRGKIHCGMISQTKMTAKRPQNMRVRFEPRPPSKCSAWNMFAGTIVVGQYATDG